MLMPQNLSLKQFAHLPAFPELLLGLQEVPAVCPQQGLFLRDEGDGIGAGESTNEFDPLIARSNVLALMFIGAR